MESPNRAYIPQVDELRALAAMAVLVFHGIHHGLAAGGLDAWPRSRFPPFSLVFEGHTGVALFMVLSGFILANGALGRPIDYGRFIKNRCLRILPLMTFVVVFGIYGSRNYSLSNILAPFLFMQNSKIALSDMAQMTGTVWTTSVEFQFYLIAPFLFAFTARGGVRGFVAPAVALVFLAKLAVLFANRGDGVAMYVISHYTIIGRLSQFLIGIGLAYVWAARGANLCPWQGILWLVVSFVGVTLLLDVVNAQGGIGVWHPWRIVFPEMEALLWAAFILGYLILKPFGRSSASKVLLFIGIRSYSMYILHWPLLKGYGVEAVAAVATVALLFPAVVLVSALSYHVIERPFLGLRGRYLADKPAAVGQP